MPWSRREFIVTSSAAAAAGVLSPATLVGQAGGGAPPPATPVFTPVRRNVGVFTARGGTIGWLQTSGAVVVIDSQFADTAQMFVDGLKSRTSRRIDLLVNSHHHGDHTGGNLTMRPWVDRIVAHANVPGLQRKQAAAQKTEAAQAYADVTFTEGWREDVGDEVVSAKYYGPGHTGGDGVIVFERANVVHMGDLMSHQRHPRVDRPSGASIGNWLALLERTVNDHSSDTIYIFGHSKVGAPVTGSRADLLALRDYFTVMLGYVREGIAAGRSAEEITKGTLGAYVDHEGTPALQVAYDELTARG